MININYLSFSHANSSLLSGLFNRRWPEPRWLGPKIKLGHRYLQFKKLREFDFSLRARTSVPSSRINSLYNLPKPNLESELEALSGLEEALGTSLSHFSGNPRALKQQLNRLGLELFSNDHQWRELIAQLVAMSSLRSEFLVCALRHYLSYLGERRDAIGSILLLHDRAELVSVADPDPAVDQLATQCLRISDAAQPSVPRGELKLPPRQAYAAALGGRRQLSIKLGGHAFAIGHDRGWFLAAESGRRYHLRPGVNSIGRSLTNHITLDPALRDISRQHLLIEPLNREAVALTDLSRSGTFLQQP